MFMAKSQHSREIPPGTGPLLPHVPSHWRRSLVGSGSQLLGVDRKMTNWRAIEDNVGLQTIYVYIYSLSSIWYIYIVYLLHDIYIYSIWYIYIYWTHALQTKGYISTRQCNHSGGFAPYSQSAVSSQLNHKKFAQDPPVFSVFCKAISGIHNFFRFSSAKAQFRAVELIKATRQAQGLESSRWCSQVRFFVNSSNYRYIMIYLPQTQVTPANLPFNQLG